MYQSNFAIQVQEHPNRYPNIRHKTNMAYWLVSDCITENRREDYVKELQKYINIDIFGNCVNRTFPRSREQEQIELMKKYKFYISFENSICNEYVTEKLYHHIGCGIVPIVMGGAKYQKILPQYSYLNVNDFKSPKELADYLLYLDRNDEKYLEYFEWTKSVNYYVRMAFCAMCKKLHNPSLPMQYYSNITDWWIHDKKHNLDCENSLRPNYKRNKRK